MTEDNNRDGSQNFPVADTKTKMLAALAKKQKGHSSGKSSGPTSGSKVGAGQTTSTPPKMHRRKAGSA
jgi:Family of unknown function (DUF5302)